MCGTKLDHDSVPIVTTQFRRVTGVLTATCVPELDYDVMQMITTHAHSFVDRDVIAVGYGTDSLVLMGDVFPLVDEWHLMLGITAGMDQKSIIVVVMAVTCAWLVLLVLLLALCFLPLSSDPRSSASCPVWMRRRTRCVLS